jgi:3-methyladenine DNA glycosylase Tag
MERDGLSHLTVQFLRYRKQFVESYRESYTRTMADFMDKVERLQIDDRVIRNMVTVCAAFRSMEQWFDFSFTYDHLLQRAIEVVKNHNDQLTRSDEMGVFWSMMEAMFDENVLIDKWHFVLSHVTGLTTNKGKLSFPEGKRVLKVKFQVVAKMYSEHMRKRGEKPLPIDSLRYYLETSKSFIGIERACKFTRKDWDPAEAKITEKKTVTSAYCFDYDMIGVNMDRQAMEEYEIPGIDVDPVSRYEIQAADDKLPF